MKKISILLIIIVLITGLSYTLYCKVQEGMEIRITNTDAAMYYPGQPVSIDIELINTTNHKKTCRPILKAYHLEKLLEEVELDKVTLSGEEKKVITYQWTPPTEDFKGYLIEIGISEIACDTIAVDVSSKWTKFPRYGFISEFASSVDPISTIEKMNRYHINGIEYYDWHYRHHEPVPHDTSNSWSDWSGRTINANVIKDFIKQAKSHNMTNMAYNMIYASTDSFLTDHIEANKWKVFFSPNNSRGEGAFKFYMGHSPSGNSNLYFMNPLNADWQKHIFSEMNYALNQIGFDGWHGDTVGEWGSMTDASGNPLGYDEYGKPINTIKDCYTQFLNNAKEALGDYYLSFNPVGAQGIEKANVSNTDVLYAEFWPWDTDRYGTTYDTYNSLCNEVERSRLDSNGKSLTVKAYINYEKTVGEMNPAGVLLCDAAVFAAGGNRLEIGDGDNMLHVEYYPAHDILMSEELKQHVIRMYDFAVAYENILRDGQTKTSCDVTIAQIKTSNSGESNSVWFYTKSDETYEILHLINLIGTDNLWRDEIGKKKTPILQTNLKVTYYTDRSIQEVYLASPDYNQGKSQPLSFQSGTDSNGSFITFEVPTLEYWDMIYMK